MSISKKKINIDSFEDFIEPNGIKNILCNKFVLKDTINYTDGQTHVHNNNEVYKTTYVLKFIDVEFKKPTYIDPITNEKKNLTPCSCKTMNLSYLAEINVSYELEVTHYYINGNKHVENVFIKELQIGKHPILVNSSLCWLKDLYQESDSYFILSGKEWIIYNINYIKEFKTNFSFTVRNDIKRQIKNTFLQTLDKSSINLNNLLNSKNIGSKRLTKFIKKSIKKINSNL